MHEGPVSIGTAARSRLERILNDINDQYAEASEEVNKAEATRDAIGEKVGRVHRALTRIDTPHSYLRSNNERLGVDEGMQLSASMWETQHARRFYHFAEPFAQANEPLTVKYMQVSTAIKNIDRSFNHDEGVPQVDADFINQVQENIAYVNTCSFFERMILRTLDENAYLEAKLVIDQTADAIREAYGIDVTQSTHLEKTA